MMININVSKDLKEFYFVGTPLGYKKFITRFKTGKITLKRIQSEFYPIEIEKVEIEKSQLPKLLLTFYVEENTLRIKGGNDKFNVFIKSIENLSNLSQVGHFYIDYLGNSDLISQKDISLVLDLIK